MEQFTQKWNSVIIYSPSSHSKLYDFLMWNKKVNFLKIILVTGILVFNIMKCNPKKYSKSFIIVVHITYCKIYINFVYKTDKI